MSDEGRPVMPRNRWRRVGGGAICRRQQPIATPDPATVRAGVAEKEQQEDAALVAFENQIADELIPEINERLQALADGRRIDDDFTKYASEGRLKYTVAQLHARVLVTFSCSETIRKRLEAQLEGYDVVFGQSTKEEYTETAIISAPH